MYEYMCICNAVNMGHIRKKQVERSKSKEASRKKQVIEFGKRMTELWHVWLFHVSIWGTHERVTSHMEEPCHVITYGHCNAL